MPFLQLDVECFGEKLQALAYDILPSTTAVVQKTVS